MTKLWFGDDYLYYINRDVKLFALRRIDIENFTMFSNIQRLLQTYLWNSMTIV